MGELIRVCVCAMVTASGCADLWHGVTVKGTGGRDLGHGEDADVVVQLAALLVTRSHHVRCAPRSPTVWHDVNHGKRRCAKECMGAGESECMRDYSHWLGLEMVYWVEGRRELTVADGVDLVDAVLVREGVEGRVKLVEHVKDVGRVDRRRHARVAHNVRKEHLQRAMNEDEIE
jgi:hypothetical protein